MIIHISGLRPRVLRIWELRPFNTLYDIQSLSMDYGGHTDITSRRLAHSYQQCIQTMSIQAIFKLVVSQKLYVNHAIQRNLSGKNHVWIRGTTARNRPTKMTHRI